MVFGGPVGTFISELAGWRAGFWAVAGVTSVASVAGLYLLPKSMTGNGTVADVRTELRAMRRPALWAALTTTAVSTAAYMGTFGYLAALLLNVSGLPVHWLPAVLTLFGLGAFTGLTIGGRTADRHLFATLVTGITGLIVTSTALALFSSYLSVTVLLVFLLGVSGFLLNPAVWARVYLIAPDAPLLAGATNSSAFQTGLTLAPLLAGWPLSLGHGLASIGWVGVITGFVALGVALLDRRLSK